MWAGESVRITVGPTAVRLIGSLFRTPEITYTLHLNALQRYSRVKGSSVSPYFEVSNNLLIRMNLYNKRPLNKSVEVSDLNSPTHISEEFPSSDNPAL